MCSGVNTNTDDLVLIRKKIIDPMGYMSFNMGVVVDFFSQLLLYHGIAIFITR